MYFKHKFVGNCVFTQKLTHTIQIYTPIHTYSVCYVWCAYHHFEFNTLKSLLLWLLFVNIKEPQANNFFMTNCV